ncbi:MAG: ATP-binding protein [Clostridia bacterium]|nr:ATP-binding protein [Clostridia bacterium]
MKRITIFAGHYGSGKTTAAVAYAKKLREQHEKVMIVDIDLINPYYRTKDAQDELDALGIRVISPTYANTNIETPSVPAEMMAAFSQKDTYVVFDAAGDDDGAVVLSRFFVEFSQEDYDFFLVVNTKRPLTKDKESIIIYKEDIETASRLRFTALVNATNLSEETEISHILEGEAIVEEVAKETDLPNRYTFVKKDLIPALPEALQQKAMAVTLFHKKPWEL